jgi:hypothetical protein
MAFNPGHRRGRQRVGLADQFTGPGAIAKIAREPLPEFQLHEIEQQQAQKHQGDDADLMVLLHV